MIADQDVYGPYEQINSGLRHGAVFRFTFGDNQRVAQYDPPDDADSSL